MYWFLCFNSYVCTYHVLMRESVHKQRSGECFGVLGAENAGMQGIAMSVLSSELWSSLLSKYSSC